MKDCTPKVHVDVQPMASCGGPWEAVKQLIKAAWEQQTVAELHLIANNPSQWLGT